MNDIFSAIDEAIEGASEQLGEFATEICNAPELGYREVNTARRACEVLRSLGLTPREGLAMTGFRADFDTGRPGPTVAILGELDALIVDGKVKHACGHHTHVTSMLAAAIGLVKAKGKGLCGKIAFIGTPAEEHVELEWRRSLIDAGKVSAISGKRAMILDGVFDDVDAAFMIHIAANPATGANAFGVPSRTLGGIKKFARFSGRSAHATADPGAGINAFSAATLAVNAVSLLRETFPSDARVTGVMSECPENPGVIPASAALEYSICADSVESILRVAASFDRAMKGAADAIGAEVKIDTFTGTMPFLNDKSLVELFLKTAERVYTGTSVTNNGHAGLDAGGSDMGDLAHVVPVVHAYCPGAKGYGHTAEFCVPDPAETCTRMGRVLAGMAATLLAGDAAAGREIAAHKKALLTKDQFADLLKKIEK